MDCKDFKNRVEKRGLKKMSKECKNHLESCQGCSQWFAGFRKLKSLFKDLPDIPLPGGIVAELNWNLAKASRQIKKREIEESKNWFNPFLVPVSFVALLTLVIFVFKMVPGELVIQRGQYLEVELEVRAKEKINNVFVEVKLPGGLQLATRKEDLKNADRIGWNTGFTPGINRYPLVVKGKKPGKYNLVVTLASGQVRFQTDLEVTIVKDHKSWSFLPIKKWMGETFILDKTHNNQRRLTLVWPTREGAGGVSVRMNRDG